jgi:hypothetical protein
MRQGGAIYSVAFGNRNSNVRVACGADNGRHCVRIDGGQHRKVAGEIALDPKEPPHRLLAAGDAVQRLQLPKEPPRYKKNAGTDSDGYQHGEHGTNHRGFLSFAFLTWDRQPTLVIFSTY